MIYRFWYKRNYKQVSIELSVSIGMLADDIRIMKPNWVERIA